MNKLEEDYTYIELQRRLKSIHDLETELKQSKADILFHINAIKKDFYQYEMEMKNGI